MSNPLLDEALCYAARGWRILPLHSIRNGHCTCKGWETCGKSAGKHPRIKTGSGHSEATTDQATIEKWWRKWPNANVGIATGQQSGLCIVDIDGPEGARLLGELVRVNAVLPATLQVTSGRPDGGRHLYYACTAPSGISAGGGLDLRGDGGLVVAPPSLHRSGTRYDWVRPLQKIAELPAWLLAWFLQREGQARERAAKPQAANIPAWLRDSRQQGHSGFTRRLASALGPVSPADLAGALEAIPNPDYGWSQYNRVVMAAWDAVEGADWAIPIVDRWSQKSRKWVEGYTTQRWAEIAGSPPTDLTFGTLVFMAREAQPDWEPPSRAVVLAAISETKQEDTAEGVGSMNGHDVNETVANHIFAAETDAKPLIKLNERFCVIGDMGGKCLVLGWVNSKVDKSLKVPSFQTFKSFSERYANQYVLRRSTDKKGKPTEEMKQVGSEWLKWSRRRSYEGIDLVPGGPQILPGDVMNLWSGFGIPAASGSWERMRWHIANILARGDADSAGYIFRYAAWAVQHPGERAEVALVFRGDKGTGKGTFANALKRLFGQHGLQIFSSRHLVGQFNGHLRNCLLLFSDEAFWAGDKAGESVLKGLLTEPTLMIEQKGIDATPWPNYLHVIMSANAEWVVPATHDERRYAMFDVAPDRRNDFAYFRALLDELAAGGLAAMLHDLQRVDLGDWHPRQIIQTEALREQKESSLAPNIEWVLSLLQEGVLPFAPGDPRGVHARVLLEDARANFNWPRWSKMVIAKTLLAWGCHRVRTEYGSLWRFPALSDMRTRWDAHYGKWGWGDDSGTWIARK